jgi:hypothetical protein
MNVELEALSKTATMPNEEPIREPSRKPNERPEVEPDKLPDEEPGIQPDTNPGKEDDDDDYEPYEEPEIGDNPDDIKTRTTIM